MGGNNCFWNAVIKLTDQNSIHNLFNHLKENNILCLNVVHNDKLLTEKEQYELIMWITERNIDQEIGNGHDCSTCDPYLVLICQLYKVNIDHVYCGHLVTYRHTNPKDDTIHRFTSNKSHFK
jgi:hypothetical protein